MPHVILEYSSNLAALADIDELVVAVHDAALATGTAPLDALRTRAVARHHYAIADRDPHNMFLAVTARLGAGRPDDEKRAFVEALLAAVVDHLGDTPTLMISVEYQEIDPTFRINRNNLRPLIAARRGE
jgi:5-carboxymethyl-2-hydroxymuconate isomerase